MKIGIGISTYRRSDGTTPTYLSRALQSIKEQTHQDFVVFLMGDNYEDHEEFNSFGKLLPEDKLHLENLPVAVERSKYPMGSHELWCSGGVNAFNRAINLCRERNIDYMCHLDHDDYWAPNHLEKINEVITQSPNAACVYTCSIYMNRPYLPRVNLDNKVYEHFPVPAQAIHSSICINHKLVNLKYRDVYAETGSALPADMDLYSRLKPYCEERALKSYLITAITCYHVNERY